MESPHHTVWTLPREVCMPRNALSSTPTLTQHWNICMVPPKSHCTACIVAKDSWEECDRAVQCFQEAMYSNPAGLFYTLILHRKPVIGCNVCIKNGKVLVNHFQPRAFLTFLAYMVKSAFVFIRKLLGAKHDIFSESQSLEGDNCWNFLCHKIFAQPFLSNLNIQGKK